MHPTIRFAFLASITLTAPLEAQRPSVTVADYDRAVSFLAPAVNRLVAGGSARGRWLPNDQFVYRSTATPDSAYFIVDPAKRTRTRASDQAAFARDESGAGRGGRRASSVAVVSPDGRRAAFIRDWNLWMRDLATGRERQLTADGVKDFGYATDNAGWVHSDRAILLWSPDSRKIATAQQDERHVGEMYLVPTTVGHPKLSAWRYPLAGDSVVAMLQHVIIDVDAGTVLRLQLPPQYHRGTISDDISVDDYKWSPDGSQLALATTSRDHKQSVLRVADARTGAVRTVLEETVPTHYESRTGWRVLWPSNEVVWYSQRDNWGQLYLYDLVTGALKNAITSGEGPVEHILRVDDTTRTIWYEALGRETG
ncbi:MAG: peptidase dipeptidylpeptidase domain protein, partial [Gemmatimonadetes bacterium]|nr:peptidase dipeptidylpeptidase domain protein [Gemmatimonadota bacterium]